MSLPLAILRRCSQRGYADQRGRSLSLISVLHGHGEVSNHVKVTIGDDTDARCLFTRHRASKPGSPIASLGPLSDYRVKLTHMSNHSNTLQKHLKVANNELVGRRTRRAYEKHIAV
jgi:hypothetical protein